MAGLHISPAGDDAIVVELGEVPVESLHAAAAAAREDLEQAACIAGKSSLYLIFADRVSPLPLVEAVMNKALASPPPDLPHRRHEIRVSFAPTSAPDLPLLLEAARLTRDEFLGRVSRLDLRARYLGFRAGFAYLEGLPPDWALPRLPTPRRAVPAGSFAVAADSAGFYPVESPGGWNLLGRTDAALWNPSRTPPNLISAGDEIAIVPDDGLEFPTSIHRPAPPTSHAPIAEVVRAGQLTLVAGAPDLGRYAFGIAPGGAFDPVAARFANAAVGNPPDAAALECALVGPALRFFGETVLSWCGADAELLVDGAAVRDIRQFSVPEGGLLEIGRIRGGMRGWLAVRGGWLDPAPKYAIAPARVRGGEHLYSQGLEARTARLGASLPADHSVLRCFAGPHSIARGLMKRIAAGEWTVTEAADRVAVRFRTSAAPPDLPAMLPSLGMMMGTVQWHPGGELVAMGPDHPVTGGYLQPLTIAAADRPKLAQLKPGDGVRWELIEPSS